MANGSREEDGCICLGHWGGQEDEPWSYKTDGRITQIIVPHGCAVDSILFQSQSCGCFTPGCSKKFGGDGADKEQSPTYKEEKRVKVEGTSSLPKHQLPDDYHPLQGHVKKFTSCSRKRKGAEEGEMDFISPPEPSISPKKSKARVAAESARSKERDKCRADAAEELKRSYDRGFYEGGRAKSVELARHVLAKEDKFKAEQHAISYRLGYNDALNAMGVVVEDARMASVMVPPYQPESDVEDDAPEAENEQAVTEETKGE